MTLVNYHPTIQLLSFVWISGPREMNLFRKAIVFCLSKFKYKFARASPGTRKFNESPRNFEFPYLRHYYLR